MFQKRDASPSDFEIPKAPVNTAKPGNGPTVPHSPVGRPREEESVVDEHANFQGQYKSDRNLRIVGLASGEIECMGRLVIDTSARVTAKIKAQDVVIAGTYQGEVDCSRRLEITPSAHVTGKLITDLFVMQEGAYFDGTVTMRRSETRKAAPVATARPQQAAAAPDLSVWQVGEVDRPTDAAGVPPGSTNLEVPKRPR
jgi:cytoskeletal protein CcmA (bactofilin family)